MEFESLKDELIYKSYGSVYNENNFMGYFRNVMVHSDIMAMLNGTKQAIKSSIELYGEYK